jgi:hypothetical protein
MAHLGETAATTIAYGVAQIRLIELPEQHIIHCLQIGNKTVVRLASMVYQRRDDNLGDFVLAEVGTEDVRVGFMRDVHNVMRVLSINVQRTGLKFI